MSLDWKMLYRRASSWIEFLVDEFRKKQAEGKTLCTRDVFERLLERLWKEHGGTMILAIVICVFIVAIHSQPDLDNFDPNHDDFEPGYDLRNADTSMRTVQKSLNARIKNIGNTSPTDNTFSVNPARYFANRTHPSTTGPLPFAFQPKRQPSSKRDIRYKDGTPTPWNSLAPPLSGLTGVYSDLRSSSRNFSSLAKHAPVFYKTLRVTGMLDKDGSPTKRWEVLKHMERKECGSPEKEDAAWKG
jgi:hypothetical protein